MKIFIRSGEPEVHGNFVVNSVSPLNTKAPRITEHKRGKAMMKRASSLQILILLCLLSSGLLTAETEPVYAIRDAKVHTLTSAGTLEKATVVIAGGKIAAVGATARIP